MDNTEHMTLKFLELSTSFMHYKNSDITPKEKIFAMPKREGKEHSSRRTDARSGFRTDLEKFSRAHSPVSSSSLAGAFAGSGEIFPGKDGGSCVRSQTPSGDAPHARPCSIVTAGMDVSVGVGCSSGAAAGLP